ncbi:hypothetical protein NP590_08370 [Methylomonas sp. SURF-2]|uniref:Transposase n=1 Tax=Methylomonas subterranea TaxID=2952225 RepID=A0ABT1TFA5_9GAMM|nr:hypothetical protein [Methylomonas sp. SURF-2]MCQ8104115.1 hypothetical protein [Methylomonas sp. SURF-2]
MRKQNKAKGLNELSLKNPVAKFAHQFNKTQVYKDKRRYQRKAKHSGLEPFSIVSLETIEKGSAFAVKTAQQGFQHL